MAKKLNDPTIATVTSLTGTEFINPVNASTGEISKITTNNAKTFFGGGGGGTAKVYAAIISQSGSGAPTEDFVCANSTGKTFTWGRTSNGTYTITANSAFFTGTTIVNCNANVGAFGFIIQHAFTSSTVLTIYVQSFAGSYVDNALNHAVIRIEQF